MKVRVTITNEDSEVLDSFTVESFPEPKTEVELANAVRGAIEDNIWLETKD